MGVSFSALCRVHAGIDLLTGAGMLYNLDWMTQLVHGDETAKTLFAENTKLRVAESLTAVLLVDIALILGVVATSKEIGFQRNFCKAALGIHASLAAFRLAYQRKIPEMKKDIPGQLVGDAIMAGTWAYWLWKN
jgi:hypothetical protein